MGVIGKLPGTGILISGKSHEASGGIMEAYWWRHLEQRGAPGSGLIKSWKHSFKKNLPQESDEKALESLDSGRGDTLSGTESDEVVWVDIGGCRNMLRKAIGFEKMGNEFSTGWLYMSGGNTEFTEVMLEIEIPKF
jgi:hypothetical protein